jgi:hypothetical protein
MKTPNVQPAYASYGAASAQLRKLSRAGIQLTDDELSVQCWVFLLRCAMARQVSGFLEKVSEFDVCLAIRDTTSRFALDRHSNEIELFDFT